MSNKTKTKIAYSTEWAEKASRIEIAEYVLQLPEGRELDYTRTGWGHTVSSDGKIGDLIMKGSIFSSSGIKPGDSFVSRAASGRIGIYKVLHVRPFGDPHDAFWIHFIGTGYKD